MKLRSILVVEDDELQILKFKKVCKEANFLIDISFAKNGVKALAIIENSNINFDLIISDINMPNMGGFEMIKILKSNLKFKKIPIVIMSNSKTENDLEQCYSLGVSGYFTKPTKFSEYSKNVTSLLNYWQNASLSLNLVG